MAITLDGTNGILSPDFEPSGSTTPTNGLFLPTANAVGLATGSTERLRIDSSGNLLVGLTSATSGGGVLQVSNGITFPATQSASSNANTLDDYEEGTWTPVVTNSGLTAYTASGTYVKIGRLVYLTWKVTLTTVGSASGGITVTNYPFAATSGMQYVSGWRNDSTGATGVTLLDGAGAVLYILGPTWTNGYVYFANLVYTATA